MTSPKKRLIRKAFSDNSIKPTLWWKAAYARELSSSQLNSVRRSPIISLTNQQAVNFVLILTSLKLSSALKKWFGERKVAQISLLNHFYTWNNYRTCQAKFYVSAHKRFYDIYCLWCAKNRNLPCFVRYFSFVIVVCSLKYATLQRKKYVGPSVDKRYRSTLSGSVGALCDERSVARRCRSADERREYVYGIKKKALKTNFILIISFWNWRNQEHHCKNSFASWFLGVLITSFLYKN